MIEAEQIMKRCQAGTRNYEEANNLHAACYGMIGKLLKQRTWVGLTDEQKYKLCNLNYNRDSELVEMVEAKLKENNWAG
jgi:hypothetical protein